MLLAGCVTVSTQSPEPTVTEAGKIVDVIDGDTVVVEGEDSARTVRLVGVNAPEHDECGAADAEQWLRSLQGESVRLQVTGRDPFDRVLAHLHVVDLHVNHELVARGLALATTADDDDPQAASLIAAEEEAYQDRRGLWASGACGSVGEPAPMEIDQGQAVVDPAGPDGEILDSELIVVVNRGDVPVDLSGWSLRDESSRHRFRFAPGTTVDTGASVVVTSADPGWSPGLSPVWSNDGDVVLLQDPAGTVVSRWRY